MLEMLEVLLKIMERACKCWIGMNVENVGSLIKDTGRSMEHVGQV